MLPTRGLHVSPECLQQGVSVCWWWCGLPALVVTTTDLGPWPSRTPTSSAVVAASVSSDTETCMTSRSGFPTEALRFLLNVRCYRMVCLRRK